ncbi:MAG: hypothetical protein AAB500_01520 [Patescibacteria group bacterium]
MPEDEVELATDEQLGHILDMWRRRLRGRKLTNPEAQAIITNGGFYLPVMDEAADVLVDRVRSEISNTIVVYLNNIKRGQTVEQLLDATGRRQYTEKSSVATMPLVGNGGPLSGEFVWFKSDGGLSDAGVEEERVRRGLVRDLEMQLQYNAEHPEFADTHPNGDSWPADDKGNYNFVGLGRWGGGRGVVVGRGGGGGWGAGDWFGGRRK